jgi:phenylalanyl-tRNA synthetase beta chain
VKDELMSAVLGINEGATNKTAPPHEIAEGADSSASRREIAKGADNSVPRREIAEGALKLSAPPSPDEKFLRTSLLPNICKAAAGNVRFFDEFAIFESAQVFLAGDFVSKYDSREKLPVQKRNVAGAFVGNDAEILFRRAKGALENLSRIVHVEKFSFARNEKPFWSDEVCWLNLIFNGKTSHFRETLTSRVDENAVERSRFSSCGTFVSHENAIIGSMGLLSKKAALSCGIKNSSVMLFEFEPDALVPLNSRENKFAHLPEFPMTDYDLSLLFDLSVKWEEIFAAINSKQDEFLRGVSFVGEYRGKQIPEGKKSVTFRLKIGASDKTLTSNEIENFANAVVKRLAKQLGAETRSA